MKTQKIKTLCLTSLCLTSLFALSACNENKATTTSVSNEKAVITDNTSTLEIKTKKAKDLAPYLERNIQDEVFYFVLPDRFNNGDTSNDNGSKTIAISSGGFDKTYNGSYHGGDIKGLEDKLDYIEGLGVTSIWLTPILRNQAVQGKDSGYHGYWVIDFTEIDPHLGSNDNLKSFIDSAHKKNIKVFFDIITNHTADIIKFTECHGEDGKGSYDDGDDCPYKSLSQKAAGDKYTPIVPKGLEHIKTPEWLNDIQYYHNQGETTYEGENSIYGDFAGLDDINTDDPVVVEKMIDVFSNLIDEFKPDGFRIDTVKHVNIEFWQAFAPALVAHAQQQGIPQFFMFGEVYSFEPEVLSKFTTKGNMQSVLDFAFQGVLARTLINQEGTDVFAQLFAKDALYNTNNQDANQLLTFTGNHDMGRFAGMLTQSDKNYSEAAQIQRTLLAHALMYFARGIPVIYYGDEQGFAGKGGDRYARQDMMPSEVVEYNKENLLATKLTTADDNFDTSHPFYKRFAEFASVYQAHPALRYGQLNTLYSQATPGVFAFARELADDKSQSVIVVANTSTEPQTLNLSNDVSTMKTLYSLSSETETQQSESGDKKGDVIIPPLSLVIYQ